MNSLFSLSKAVSLYFVRHGSHIYSKDVTVGGSLATKFIEAGMGGYAPLSDKGKEQAVQARRIFDILKPAAILHTQTTRTRHTAEIINEPLEKKLYSFADMRDQDWGNWTGMDKGERDQNVKKGIFPEDGESPAQLKERILSVGWPKVLECCTSFEAPVLLVGHDTNLKVFKKHLGMEDFVPGNGEVLKLVFNVQSQHPEIEIYKVTLSPDSQGQILEEKIVAPVAAQAAQMAVPA